MKRCKYAKLRLSLPTRYTCKARDRSMPTNFLSCCKAAYVLLPLKILTKSQRYFLVTVTLPESKHLLRKQFLQRSLRQAVLRPGWGEQSCWQRVSALGGAVACGEAAAAPRGGSVRRLLRPAASQRCHEYC